MKQGDKKILDLPLKAKWYLMQESGEKTEEYREITPYWISRLTEHEIGPDPNMIDPRRTFKPYTHVRFRYGYTKRTFTHRIDSITIGLGKTEWGAPTDKKVFIIKHHKEGIVMAAKAPEKIYYDIKRLKSNLWNIKCADTDIEYTRTDAFIEKAVKWLSDVSIEDMTYKYNSFDTSEGWYKFIDDFRKAMEE